MHELFETDHIFVLSLFSSQLSPQQGADFDGGSWFSYRSKTEFNGIKKDKNQRVMSFCNVLVLVSINLDSAPQLNPQG